MPDIRALIASMARQMYDDVRLVTEANALQPLDEDTTRHINHLLRMTRDCYPNVRLLDPFQDMAPRTIKYKDTVMIIGQLKELLTQLEAADLPATSVSVVRTSASSTAVNMPAIPASTRTTLNLTPQPHMPAKPGGRPASSAFPYVPAQTDSDEPAVPAMPPPPMPKPRVVPGAPIMAPAPAMKNATADEELYGPVPPSRRNADGTVPFSLDDEH